ncbi:MAG: hypothetical protein ACI90V_013037, partial [Bacillariaceae sp.]
CGPFFIELKGNTFFFFNTKKNRRCFGSSQSSNANRLLSICR